MHDIESPRKTSHSQLGPFTKGRQFGQGEFSESELIPSSTMDQDLRIEQVKQWPSICVTAAMKEFNKWLNTHFYPTDMPRDKLLALPQGYEGL